MKLDVVGDDAGRLLDDLDAKLSALDRQAVGRRRAVPERHAGRDAGGRPQPERGPRPAQALSVRVPVRRGAAAGAGAREGEEVMRRSAFGLPARVARGFVLVAALLACACASKLARTPRDLHDRSAAAASGPRRGGEPHPVAAQRRGGADLCRLGARVPRRRARASSAIPYASLAAPPSRLLTAAMRGYLRDSDYVRDVVAPGEGLPVDADARARAAGALRGFQQPGRAGRGPDAAHPRPVRPGAGAAPEREILLRTYTRRVPLSQRTAVAVVAAWNRALGEIMAEFLADLKPVLPPPRVTPGNPG